MIFGWQLYLAYLSCGNIPVENMYPLCNTCKEYVVRPCTHKKRYKICYVVFERKDVLEKK